MDAPPVSKPGWTCDPLRVAAAWPEDRPLFFLHSARPHPRWGRWSILASPREVVRIYGEADLDRLESPRVHEDESPVVFRGGWIGYLSYDLGRHLEPSARHVDAAGGPGGAADDRGWPLGLFGWCPDALVYDGRERTWFAVGDPPPVSPTARGDGDAFETGALGSVVDPDAYLSAVAATKAYIAAGDVFQANIAHRLTAVFEGSTRRLGLEALALSGAWYGAYLELPEGRSLVSASPELFLELDGGGRVVTRPIKGTRPSGADPRELADSAKDAAELNMIVDLMRNDLGRVCAYGTVRVARARTIETHPTVHHGVAEVTGRLRRGIGLVPLLRATFPAGSVTGAPKIRAMQIIDELESVRRGPYCGSIGYVSVCGRAALNVAIRTMTLTGRRPEGSWGRLSGVLDYGVGGGIVADSDPAAEYRETMDKAEVLRQVLKTRKTRDSLHLSLSSVHRRLERATPAKSGGCP